MMTTSKWAPVALAALAMTLATRTAAAGDDDNSDQPRPHPPAAATIRVAKSDEGTPDHDSVVGHVGLTYFGVTDLPIASALGGGSATIAAPVIGGRYWLNRDLGLDIGLGLGFAGGSSTVSTGGMSTSVSRPGENGFALHGGVPLVFSEGKHYTFEVIPELTFGYASSSIKGMGMNPDTSLSGILFLAGARLGSEIHFGFMGIPELSLQATIGLFFENQTVNASQGNNSSSTTSNQFATTVQGAPWAIFSNTIAAVYYF
jgi:hypothetical protein